MPSGSLHHTPLGLSGLLLCELSREQYPEILTHLMATAAPPAPVGGRSWEGRGSGSQAEASSRPLQARYFGGSRQNWSHAMSHPAPPGVRLIPPGPRAAGTWPVAI